ncbi:MAG: hypothetical protein M3O62_00550 [Pseudomonadota bacterium]|nr:hypothetical protein [Pseudomonadota bacterium]
MNRLMAAAFSPALALVLALGLSACNKGEQPDATSSVPSDMAAPTAAPVPDAVEAAADSAAVPQICTQDCGDGVVATIQCAEGQTPVCDCNAEPKAHCAGTPAPTPAETVTP